MRDSLLSLLAMASVAAVMGKNLVVEEYNNVSNDLPEFLQKSSPYYRMVAFHDSKCTTCESFIPSYDTLAYRMLNYTTLLRVHSISCTSHRSLCSMHEIAHYPTVRLYAPHQSVGMPLLPEQLHPYKILDKLDLLTDTSMARPFLDDTSYFKENDSDDDAEFLKELEEVYRVKRGLTEQDMQFALEQWLRHYTFSDYTTTMDAATNTRTLQPHVTTTLRTFLELLRNVVTEVPGGIRMAAVVREIRNNIGYVARDEQYLANILLEHSAEDWSAACQMTTDGGSSYLCGLWKLLYRLAIGIREYRQAAVRPVWFPNIRALLQRLQREMGLFCSLEDTQCVNIVTEDDDYPDDEEAEEDYYSLVLWMTELRQDLQRYLRVQQKMMLKLPYTYTDEEVTQWPPRSRCALCWNPDGSRNKHVTITFVELEYGRSVLWKDVLPLYDVVHPEDEDDEGNDEL